MRGMVCAPQKCRVEHGVDVVLDADPEVIEAFSLDAKRLSGSMQVSPLISISMATSRPLRLRRGVGQRPQILRDQLRRQQLQGVDAADPNGSSSRP